MRLFDYKLEEGADDMLKTYVGGLNKTLQTGTIVDAALAAANLPFLFQKRQVFPRQNIPKIRAPQLRDNSAFYKTLATNALAVSDFSNRKYLNEAGMPGLYSTANYNQALNEANVNAYERSQQIGAANQQSAYDAQVKNIAAQVQADALQQQGQMQLDEQHRQAKLQSLANVLQYGSSIASRFNERDNRALYATTAFSDLSDDQLIRLFPQF